MQICIPIPVDIINTKEGGLSVYLDFKGPLESTRKETTKWCDQWTEEWQNNGVKLHWI